MNTRTISEDFSTWVRGQAPTASQLLCLYESDFVVQFAIDGMTEDATNHWLKNFKEPNPDAPIAPKIVNAMKWADLYGDAIAVLLDKANEDGEVTNLDLLAKPFSGKAVGLDVFYPIADGDGYDDPDPKTDMDEFGNPKVFKVHIKGSGDTITIDASRCIIFKGRETRRSWRGMYVGIGSLDDVIDYRKWRASYGVRASDVAIPGYHANKEKEDATWSAAEKTSLDSAFGVGNVAATTGKTSITQIGGVLTPGELDSTAIGLLNAIAVDLGVELTDIFKSQGNNEKFAPDSNQSTYMIALVSKLKRHEESVKKVLKAFGIKWEGWNSVWEEPFQQQILNINGLSKTYNESADPETKAIVKSILVSQYGEKTSYKEYLATERANAERDAKRLAEFTNSGGFNGRTSSSAGSDGSRGTDRNE
jgi:hypothetical protein